MPLYSYSDFIPVFLNPDDHALNCEAVRFIFLWIPAHRCVRHGRRKPRLKKLRINDMTTLCKLVPILFCDFALSPVSAVFGNHANAKKVI